MNLEKKNPVIFIISGKANAGKDTTANFIKEFANEKDLKTINLQFSSYIKMYAQKLTDWDGKEETKPRSLLQELGTEVIRNKIDNMFFIKRIIEDIKVYSFYSDIITISDARMPEELENIANTYENTYKLNIVRPNFTSSLNETQKTHKTETALNDYNNYDYIIQNDGSLEDLKERINNIIKEII